MERINEDSVGYLTAKFYDKDDNLVVPTSISYNIYCLTTGTEIKDATAISPANTVEITLSSIDNAIIVQTNRLEMKLVTITATFGVQDLSVEEYRYFVKNMKMRT